jgi:Xaa-Pro aminopeptidase
MGNLKITPPGFKKELLLKLIQEHHLTGVLLTSPENVYYTTGYPTLPGSGNPIIFALQNQFPYYVYISVEGKVTLVGWMGALNGIDFAADDSRFFFNHSSALEELSNVLKENLSGQATLGVESTCSMAVLDTLKAALDEHVPALFNVDPLMTQLRLIKSPAEIELIKRSTAVVEAAVAELSEIVHVGMTRRQLIQEAKTRMMAHGADAIDHVTAGFGTANLEVEIEQTLEPNQLVQLDLGASVRGYVSDNRRILYSGEVTDEIRQPHEKVCAIIDQMGAALKPGARFPQIYQMAYERFTQENLAPLFMNAGHTIGLQTEEVWLIEDNDVEVQPGMVVNIEVYTAHITGEPIGDEETFVVTPTGSERITQLPRAIKSVK